jgi:hypothetical protein
MEQTFELLPSGMPITTLITAMDARDNMLCYGTSAGDTVLCQPSLQANELKWVQLGVIKVIDQVRSRGKG